MFRDCTHRNLKEEETAAAGAAEVGLAAKEGEDAVAEVAVAKEAGGSAAAEWVAKEVEDSAAADSAGGFDMEGSTAAGSMHMHRLNLPSKEKHSTS
jgi:hypothetical protein